MNTRLLMLCGMMLFLLPLFENATAQTENPNILVDDPSFLRESLQTGETITTQGTFTVMVIEGLGAILIVVFIVIYAIKKKAKGVSKHDNN